MGLDLAVLEMLNDNLSQGTVENCGSNRRTIEGFIYGLPTELNPCSLQ
jgi:hypothetical protein